MSFPIWFCPLNLTLNWTWILLLLCHDSPLFTDFYVILSCSITVQCTCYDQKISGDVEKSPSQNPPLNFQPSSPVTACLLASNHLGLHHSCSFFPLKGFRKSLCLFSKLSFSLAARSKSPFSSALIWNDDNLSFSQDQITSLTVTWCLVSVYSQWVPACHRCQPRWAS